MYFHLVESSPAIREKPAYPTPVSFPMNNFAPLEIVQQQGFGTVVYLRA
jgi:hypothetical protein